MKTNSFIEAIKIEPNKDDIEQLDSTSNSLKKMAEKALSVEIESEEDYQYAANSLQVVESITKVISEITERFRKPAYDYYQSVLKAKKDLVQPGEEASKHLRAQMSGYIKRREQLRAEEARKLIEQQNRIAKENAENAFLTAIESGDDLGAELALEDAVAASVAPNTTISVAPPEIEGIQYRDNWSAELVGPSGLKILCAAIAEGRAPEDLVSFNSSKANQIARSLKHEMKIPGIRAVNNKVIVRR